MGRYDKIRCWNNGEDQPSEVLYYNGSSWVSLGGNDSSNTNSMYVFDGSNWVRKSLNKVAHYHSVDKYLQRNGGGLGSLNGNSYQNHNSYYEFIIQPDQAANMMLFECCLTSDHSRCYCRIGLYVKDGVFYAYGTSRFNNQTSYETKTSSAGTMYAGVKYKITAQAGQAIKAYNYSTGGTLTGSSGLNGTFYAWLCSAGMFEGISYSGRSYYGKIWYAYIQGCNNSTTTNYARYDVNSTSVGASQLALTNYSNAGGGSAQAVTHSGSIIDNSYYTYTWE